MNWNRMDRTKAVGVTGISGAQTGQPQVPFSFTPLGGNVRDGLEEKSRTGVMLGGGGDWRFPIFHISPQVRYSRWIHPNFAEHPFGNAPGRSFLSSHLNQVEILLGISFRIR